MKTLTFENALVVVAAIIIMLIATQLPQPWNSHLHSDWWNNGLYGQI